MKVEEFASKGELQKFLSENVDIDIVSITPFYVEKEVRNIVPGVEIVEIRNSHFNYVLQYEDVKAVNDESIGKLFDMVWTNDGYCQLHPECNYDNAKDEFNYFFKQWYQRVIQNIHPDQDNT